MKFKPVGERVLVKKVEREEKTDSGIFIPDTARSDQSRAKVVAVGDSSETGVSEGDLVVFARFSGMSIKLDNEDHLVLGSDDLLGIIEE